MNESTQKEAVRRKERAINRRSTWWSLIAIAVLLGLSYWVIVLGESPIKHMQQRMNEFKAHSVELLIERIENASGKLAFFVNAAEPIHVALYVSVDQQKPVELYAGAKVPPGRHHSVAKGDTRYLYELDTAPHALHFCLVYAANAESLVKEMNSRAVDDPRTKTMACADYPAV